MGPHHRCSTCGNLCQGRCISFPPLEELRRAYKDHRVWAHVKEAMIAEGKIPAETDGVKEVED